MQYNVRGYVDCGTIEFDAAKRTWNVAPDAEIDAPVTEAKRIEFSDPDHDSVFHPE
jgi:hypothetical protein